MMSNRRKKTHSSDNILPFWKSLRIVILGLILLVVAVNAWKDNNQDWDKTIIVLLHPINADGQETTQRYISQLKTADFIDAQQYIKQNSEHYRGKSVSMSIKFARQLDEQPPKVPQSHSVLDIMLWSLKFRYYAWRQEQQGEHPTVTLYLNYYDPKLTKSLKHSTALQNGRIGIVNLFADQQYHGSNQVIIVHELLHAFGATDKYDLTTGQPIYPIGFAEPSKQPQYPQTKAEIMGGYIAISPTERKTPNHLKETIVNDLTATEIGWKTSE